MKLVSRIRRWWRRRKNPYFKVAKLMAANAREVKRKIEQGELPRIEEEDEEVERRLPGPW